MLAVLVARQPRLHPVAAVDARVAPPQRPHRRRATPACRAHQSVTVHPSSLAHSRSDRLTRPAEPSSSRFDAVLGRPCAAHRPTSDRARAGDQTNVRSRTDRDPPRRRGECPPVPLRRGRGTPAARRRTTPATAARPLREPGRTALPLQVGGREHVRPPRSVTSRPSPAPDSPPHRRSVPSWTTSMKVFTRFALVDHRSLGHRLSRRPAVRSGAVAVFRVNRASATDIGRVVEAPSPCFGTPEGLADNGTRELLRLAERRPATRLTRPEATGRALELVLPSRIGHGDSGTPPKPAPTAPSTVNGPRHRRRAGERRACGGCGPTIGSGEAATDSEARNGDAGPAVTAHDVRRQTNL
ncbi:hypothetical protein STSO111631_05200 [Stackebrandtia soli]